MHRKVSAIPVIPRQAFLLPTRNVVEHPDGADHDWS